MSISKIFIPNSLCVFSQIKDRNHIEDNFHSVARVINMSISKIFIPNSLCVFSQIKDRNHIEDNFHSVARVMHGFGLVGAGGFKNFSVGICDGAPSTAHSSLI